VYAVASVVLGWIAIAIGLVIGRRIPRHPNEAT